MNRSTQRKPFVICLGGSATIDQIFLVEEVKLPSAKLMAKDFVETGGGMGANAAVAVQRLGGQAAYWGRVGNDEAGEQVIALLAQEGIDVSCLRRLDGFRTKLASILIDRRGERLVVSSQPQGYPPDPNWLPLEKVARADAVLADTRWLAGARRLFDAAAEHRIPSVFDGDAGQPPQVLEAAAHATHPFFAETMLASFHMGPPEESLPRVYGGRNVVCGVTLGGAGVMWFDGKKICTQPAPRIKAVDTLAAGDTWHGALALALAEGQELEEAIAFATAAAALKCTRFGGRAGIPRREEFEQWRASALARSLR
ncbi:MAG TPA: PfkB family carbohydrate kinase [Burkholderiaceae bacterium]|nr:PfkB family carbohydrate kinase [Burkholderiaceae bacterium]